MPKAKPPAPAKSSIEVNSLVGDVSFSSVHLEESISLISRTPFMSSMRKNPLPVSSY